MTCQKCGKKLKRGDKFCGGCGAEVLRKPAKPVCPKCGKVLDAGSKFCNGCGAAVNGGTGGTGEYSWKKGEEKVSWNGGNEKPIKPKRGKKKPLLIVLTLAAVIAAGCFLYDFYLDQTYDRAELDAILAQFAEDESSQEYQMDSATKAEVDEQIEALKDGNSSASNSSTNSSSSSKKNTTSSSSSDASVLPNFIDCDRSGKFGMKRENHGDVYGWASCTQTGELLYIVEEYIDRLEDMGYEITYEESKDFRGGDISYDWTLSHDAVDGTVKLDVDDWGDQSHKIYVTITYGGDITMKGVSTSSNGGSSGGSSGSGIDWSIHDDDDDEKRYCHTCRNAGKVECSACDGKRGKYVSDNSTPNYSGRGTTSTKRWEYCSKCYGTATMDCPNC